MELSVNLQTLKLNDTSKAKIQDHAARKPAKDSLNRSYGKGGRKTSVARVWIKPGKGTVMINGKIIDQYFARQTLHNVVLRAFVVTGTSGKFDVYCTVKGGGHSGQAGALSLGIARALDQFDPSLHSILRKLGLLTRDPRAVERKKYGQHKARKSTQFSKR